MRLNKKSISKVSLLDLLRRKHSNLEKFLHENGIVTYDRLVSRCASIGVVPPSEDQFNNSMGNPKVHQFSSPTEGIVVLNPIAEDNQNNTDLTDHEQVTEISENTLTAKKRKRKSSSDDSI
jgi:hypothetical protein